MRRESYKRQNRRLRRKWFVTILCVGLILQGMGTVAFADDPKDAGLCEHHTEHTDACGYREGIAGNACSHEHTEDCYTLQTNCIHTHDEACYPDENDLPSKFTHVCSAESGCITKELNCTHVHDETCGYVEAAEGSPCNYDCSTCSELASDSGDVDTQTLNSDTVAVIENPDGTYAQYATLKEAIDAVGNGQNDATTIKIVKDMTITEAIRIENKKIRLEADETRTITFNAGNCNGFQAAGHSKPASLAIGENITVTTTSDSMRSIVNVGGKYGSFSLEGGTLSSGSADLARAIVCVDNGGTVSMSGGKIQGDKNHNSRGVILQHYKDSKIRFTMTGGIITDCSLLNSNSVRNSGAGILMIGESEFTMDGGKITNCSAVTGQGGGVAVLGQGVFTLNDGTIENCSSGSGGYIYVASGATYILNGGAAQIGDEKYLSLKEAIDAVENGQNDATTIKIVKDMTITEPVVIKNKKIKLEADEARTITFDAGNCDGFQAAGHSKPASLAIGKNITVTTTSDSMRSIVNVGGQYGFFSLEGGTLSSGSADLAKAIVCVDNGGTVSMSGGKIQGDKNHNSRGVFLQYYKEPEMKFTMTGGIVADCTLVDKTANQGDGAGVLIIGKAQFTMDGGAITNCSAAGRGGGVAVLGQGIFTLNDGTIENCSSGSGGYIYVASGATYTLNGGTAQIGDEKYLSLKEAIDAVGNGQDDATTIRIIKDMTITEPIEIENRKIKLTATSSHIITFDIPDNAENRNCFQVSGHSKPSSLSIGEKLTVTTTSNSLKSIVNVGGKDGFFSLEGGTLSSGSADLARAIVCVDNGGTMSMSSGKIQGNKDHNSRGVILQHYQDSKISFTMTGGVITDCSLLNSNSVRNSGAGILMIGESEFTMDGGKITNCSAVTGQGGGVAITAKSRFNMYSGEILACTTAQGGGGVMAEKNSTFMLYGGKICGCKADGNGSVGGGVYLKDKNTIFTMSGGTVCDNTAEYLGGGIYTQSDIEITAGTIQNNKTTCAVGYGGGIYAHKGATLKLTNVVITDNTAAALGGGIWSCRTGDIKIYIKDGGALFDNNAISNSGKTSKQAGDDIASTVTLPAEGFLLISHRMLGGGENRYYVDGGVTAFSPAGLSHYHGAGPGLGAPDGTTARYGAAASSLVTETYITKAIALKNVVSEEAKNGANVNAKLMISGNSASRGGGIGTNGNLIIGTPDPDSETGNLTVKKEVAGKDQETEREFSIQVTLKRDNDTAADITGEYGEMTFTDGIAVVSLKAGQSITAAGLPTGIGYTVEETAESQNGYTVTYNNQTGTIKKDDTIIATVTNNKSSGGITPNYTSVTVKKVWNLDDGGKAAGSVKAALLKNGVVDEIVTLNAANNWTHTWTGLDLGNIWTVQELDVPEGFDSIISSMGTQFTITNDDKPGSPDDPNKPDDPDNPDKPTKPDKPSKPTKPAKPAKPDPSMVPDEPMIPGGSSGSASGIPQTGDSANAALWLMLTGLSAAGITVLFLSKRKKTERNID